MSDNGAHPDYGDGGRYTTRDLDPEEIDRLLAELNPEAAIPAPAVELQPDAELDEFLNEAEPDYEWLIPDVLERGDRVILTGEEGSGKSTLLRQIAVQYAAGLHPFTLQTIQPGRALLVDLENGRRHVKREMRPLRIAARQDYPSGRLNIIVRGSGINLCSELDRVWLEERIKANEPDLLIIGPTYKMAAGDPTEEVTARTVALCLDELRVRYGLTLLIEAHQPYAASGGKRPERPYGASLWSRWPEFGLHVGKEGQLRHWRGDRDERKWPSLLTRGGEWPWTVSSEKSARTYAAIVAAVTDHGGPMSYQEIAHATGFSKSWVGDTIKANRKHFEKVQANIGGDWGRT